MRAIFGAIITTIGLMAGLIGAPASSAANSFATNPLGFAYNFTDGAPMAKARYSHPTGMVITGRCNRYQQGFADARAAGAEVLAYLNASQRPDSPVCAADTEFYGGDLSQTPLWPTPSYGQRVNWAGTHLTDMRVGSAWVDQVVDYIEHLMVEDRVDGVFLDDVGARLWTELSGWEDTKGSNVWTQAEKDAWTAGQVDLVRRLDASRRALNPRFILVNNNLWQGAGTLGRGGEPYVDGICLEHHSWSSDFHKAEAGRAFSNLGHRRVLVIALSTAEAQQWAGVQGVTHVSDQTTAMGYGIPSPPPIGFNRLTDRPKQFGRLDVAPTPSGGMLANHKRGSKFTLVEKGTLLRFSAYLDGAGGSAGSQTVRMVLYRDSGGVPGTLVAQSGTTTITAGSTGRWVSFAASATALDPGAYWIVIHTGDTAGVSRNRGGDGPANWYGNADPFSDGPANPFGTGTTGTGTLSINVSYTVGY